MTHSVESAAGYAKVQPPTKQDRGHVTMKSFKQFAQTKVDRWHWPGVLLASIILGLLTQAALHRDGVASLRMRLGLQLQAQREYTLLEQQLLGCRTIKSQPIPYVDTTASLKVLDTYSSEKQEQAEQFAAAVQACTNFTCLQQANKLPRAPGQFRYPHFFILGFPKCATTSLYCHMIQHPQVQYPREKESHVLADKCSRDLASCPADVQQTYIVDMLNMAEASQAKFTKATFDGSTHYAAQADWMAEQLAATFPWLKVVISMRDPISQAIAMHLHNLAHNRTAPCWEDSGHRIYPCVIESLEADDRARYAPKIEKWMEHFPPEQLLLVQFENITNKNYMEGDLRRFKAFLEVDTELPSNLLPLTNWKHKRGDPNALGRYWNMTRTEYEHLVDLARRNTLEVVRLMGKKGHADQQGKVDFLRNWELVWRANLRDNCEEGPQGNCKIVVS